MSSARHRCVLGRRRTPKAPSEDASHRGNQTRCIAVIVAAPGRGGRGAFFFSFFPRGNWAPPPVNAPDFVVLPFGFRAFDESVGMRGHDGTRDERRWILHRHRRDDALAHSGGFPVVALGCSATGFAARPSCHNFYRQTQGSVERPSRVSLAKSVTPRSRASDVVIEVSLAGYPLRSSRVAPRSRADF